jgi:hypothetical protein
MGQSSSIITEKTAYMAGFDSNTMKSISSDYKDCEYCTNSFNLTNGHTIIECVNNLKALCHLVYDKNGNFVTHASVHILIRKFQKIQYESDIIMKEVLNYEADNEIIAK